MVDPALTHHLVVFAAMAASLALAVVLAACGAATIRLPRRHALVLVPLAAHVPVVHLSGTVVLAANPEALGMIMG